nr:DUF6774 domain-containing protein [uncultured Caproiciproducens sp.]
MNNCFGEKLTALSAAIAIQISQYTNDEDLVVLGALFTTIGDQLSLLAAVNASCSPDNKKNGNEKQ